MLQNILDLDPILLLFQFTMHISNLDFEKRIYGMCMNLDLDPWIHILLFRTTSDFTPYRAYLNLCL